ncbi:MAG: hypothetical protein ACKN9U_14085 [Pirellulaceae bacterium]
MASSPPPFASQERSVAGGGGATESTGRLVDWRASFGALWAMEIAVHRPQGLAEPAEGSIPT